MAAPGQDPGRDGGPLRGALGPRRGGGPRRRWRTKDELSIVGRPRARVTGPEARLRRRRVRLGHLAARHARTRPCCAARTRTRRSSSTSRRRAPCPACTRCWRPATTLTTTACRCWPPSPSTRARRRRGGRRDARGGPAGVDALNPSGRRCRSSSTSRRACASSVSPRTRPRASAATSTRPSSEADVIIEAEYRTPAQLQQALEPHCAVAWWTQDELRLDLDPGHLRRPQRAREGLRDGRRAAST